MRQSGSVAAPCLYTWPQLVCELSCTHLTPQWYSLWTHFIFLFTSKNSKNCFRHCDTHYKSSFLMSLPPPNPSAASVPSLLPVCWSVWRRRIVVLRVIPTPLLNTHAETHCNTLQLTAAHCSSLQYNTPIATHCSSLQHTATHRTP